MPNKVDRGKITVNKQHILITGGAGFIGSHLSEALLEQGHSITVIDNLSTGQLENISHLQSHPNYQFVRETITNALVLDRIASTADTIVHLAAAVGVKLIVEDPVHTIETNIMGTDGVLKTAVRYGCKVLLASTSEVYGKGVSVPFREDDDRLMGATTRSRWSYATSKAIDEFMGLAYHQQFGLPVVVMRFFNTVGPRQSDKYGMVVPRFVRQALQNKPISIYGDGQQTRCFADVADVIKGVMGLIEQEKAIGEIFNIGNDEEISIARLAERVISLTGSQAGVSFTPYEEAYAPGFEDMQRRVPSIDKIGQFTGYEPTYSLNDILERVIRYEKGQLGIA